MNEPHRQITYFGICKLEDVNQSAHTRGLAITFIVNCLIFDIVKLVLKVSIYVVVGYNPGKTFFSVLSFHPGFYACPHYLQV